MLTHVNIFDNVLSMQLFKHQIEAIESANKNIAILHDCGLGKTRTAIEIFKTKPCAVCLVVAPISLLESAWEDDIKKFSDIKFCNIRNGDSIPVEKHFLLVNYEYLLSEKKLNSLMKLIPNDSMIVVDESSRMKNYKSKTTKILLALRDKFKYRYVMSGTAAPNSELEYYSQMEFVQPGIFGSSFFKFRNTFFHLSRGKDVMQGRFLPPKEMQKLFMSGWKYQITPYNQKRLMGIIAPYCDVKKKSECLDLPEEIDEIRLVELKDERKNYDEMRKHLITEINGRFITAQVALAKAMKLRQICAGFAYSDDEKSHEIGTSKLTELMALLEELGDQQVIIWGQFHFEIEKLLSTLPNSCSLYSGTKDKQDSINGFKEGRYKYLIAHPRSAGHGLTFTNCHTQIFFSIDYSYEMFEQCRARTHRAGQKSNCTYIYLLAKNTIDEKIYDVLKKKGDIQECLKTLQE